MHEEAFGARHAQGPIWGRLGEIKSSSGKQDEAIQLFERALVADPSLYETRFALALLLEETGSKEESTTQLEAVVEAEWSHAEAHFELGERALKAKDGQRAEMHFLIVTDLVPDHHEAIDRLKLIARR